MNTSTLANEIAALERQLKVAPNATAKKALEAKISAKKAEMKSGKTETANSLATKLLKAKGKVKELSSKDFNDMIKRLAQKPEYKFLKSMSRDEIHRDIQRSAKPLGWRFKGKSNAKPTKSQIATGKKNGTVYFEDRKNRSDISRVAQLAKGGGIGKFDPKSLIGAFYYSQYTDGHITDIRIISEDNIKVEYSDGGLVVTKTYTKEELFDLSKGKTINGANIFLKKMATGGGIYSSDDRWVVTFINLDSAEFEKVTVRANNKKSAIAIAEDESGLGSDWAYYSAEKQMANGGGIGSALKNTTYVSNRDIDSLTLTLKGQLKTISGKNILDGVYVKNNVTKSKGGNSANEIHKRILSDTKNVRVFEKGEEKLVTIADIEKLISVGYNEEQIRTIYLGYSFDHKIECDNEFEGYDSIFSYREEAVKRNINNLIKNGEEKEFSMGLKYPDFNWSSIISKYKISLEPKNVKRKIDFKNGDYEENIYQIFVGNKIVIGQLKERKIYKNGKLKETRQEDNVVSNPKVKNKYQVERDLHAGFNSGYWGIVSSDINVIDDIAKILTSQTDAYLKDLSMYKNGLGGVDSEELKENNVKFATGGGVGYEILDDLKYDSFANGGMMAKGGKLDVGVYRVGKPTKVSPNLYEQKIVEIFDNGDISTASDYGRSLSDFKVQKYPIISKERLEEQYKYADGGMMAKGGEVSTKLKMLKEKSNGYFPNIEPTKERSYYLWETPKSAKSSFIIESRSVYSDVGSSFYIYDKDYKFLGSANQLNGFNDVKPLRITKSDVKFEDGGMMAKGGNMGNEHHRTH